MKKLTFLILLTFAIATGLFAQIDNREKPEILSTFRKVNSKNYFLNIGGVHRIIPKYLSNPKGFSVHYYIKEKENFTEGGNFLAAILKESFFELQAEFEDEFIDLFGSEYKSIVSRLKKGENFYIFKKGQINKLIICAQDKSSFEKYLSNLLTPCFKIDAVDTDRDGLPDYFESELNSNIHHIDTDRDGLTDYEEYCKYKTNLLSNDSDGDGIIDSVSEERREYSYSIKVIREIYSPFNKEVMFDLFQDVKILSETKDKLVHEVVIYPEAINMIIPSSKVDNEISKELGKYIKPSFFCNYSSTMKNELDEIILEWDESTDYGTLKHLSDYAIAISKQYPSGEPLQFFIEASNGEVQIVHKERFEDLKTSHFVTSDRVLNNLAFGNEMYFNRMRGSCSSSSIFLASIYRAANFPTRIVSSNPLINFSDSTQISLLSNLTNENVRNHLQQVARRSGGYISHFFNETFVGGRWIRCDYNNINTGAIFDWIGPLIIQHRFIDFDTEHYAETWGERMVENRGNWYNTIELSDQNPIHNKYVNKK